MNNQFQLFEKIFPQIKDSNLKNPQEDFFKEEVIRFRSIAGTIKNSFKNVDTEIDERIISHILLRSIIENYFWLLYIFEDINNSSNRFNEYLNGFKIEYYKLYNDENFNLKSKIKKPDPSWQSLPKPKDLNSILSIMFNIHGDKLNFLYPVYRVLSFDTHGKSLSALFKASFKNGNNFPFIKIDPIIDLISDEYLGIWDKIKKSLS